MIFARKSLGVEISPSGVAFALMGGSARAPRLERVSLCPLSPGTVRFSMKEANIIDVKAFAASLKEAYNKLLYRGTRLSLSLPDTVGRLLLLEVEGRFKSHNDAIDIIRWKLKKSMPFDIVDSHLDFQQLKIRENGDMVLLVALVSRTVICQYEEVFSAAGFAPATINFNILNLCRTFERHLAGLSDGALVSFYDGIMVIIFFYEGLPEFIRIKDLSGELHNADRLYQEIASSYLVHRERFPERISQHLICIAPPDIDRDFCSSMAEITGAKPVLLMAKSELALSENVPSDLFPFMAAIGAALRSL